MKCVGSSRRARILAKNRLSQRKRTLTSLKTLAIDFGERRIGLAISDPSGKFALPLGVVERETDRRAVYQIAEIVTREAVESLVVGEPLSLEGEVGAAAERAHRFGHKLQKITGLPLRWINESLTTVEATERLASVGLDSPDHPGRRDAVAAQVLLQEALDFRQQESDR